jgi:hypothetical protein
VLTLSGKQRQRLRSFLKVGISANENSAAEATGTLVVKAPGRGRKAADRFRLRPATAGLSANVPAIAKLKLSRRARRATAKAFQSAGNARAKLTVTATDAAGNAASAKRAVRLRKPKR